MAVSEVCQFAWDSVLQGEQWDFAELSVKMCDIKASPYYGRVFIVNPSTDKIDLSMPVSKAVFEAFWKDEHGHQPE